jgi:6-pyruvoyltetrahydropterin/6-carboxytetrahydropterin synthase
VIDFIAFRDCLAAIVKQVDHHVLLPSQHAEIQVCEEGQEVTVQFRHKRWVFPREDCAILPVVNTTAEEIAAWIALQIRQQLRPRIGDRIQFLEVGVDENHGQWGIARIPW